MTSFNPNKPRNDTKEEVLVEKRNVKSKLQRKVALYSLSKERKKVGFTDGQVNV